MQRLRRPIVRDLILFAQPRPQRIAIRAQPARFHRRQERLAHRPPGLVARVHVRRQRRRDHLPQRRGNPQFRVARPLPSARGDGLQQVQGVVIVIQRLRAQRFVEQDAGAEEIAAVVDPLPARLLRAHVVDLAFDGPGLGVACPLLGAGDAKVAELDLAQPGQQHVLRADVPVHNAERLAVFVAATVGVIEPGADFSDDEAGKSLRQRQAPAVDPLQHLEQVRAFHELKRDVATALHLARIEDLHDVGMREPADDARLVGDHLGEPFVLAVFREDALDGDRTRKAAWAFNRGAKDLRHAAATEPLLQKVSAILAGKFAHRHSA